MEYGWHIVVYKWTASAHEQLTLECAPTQLHKVLSAVDVLHFGEALQSRDLTAVWGFRTLLGRDFSSVGEYRNAVASLPDLVLGARGARAAFARSIVASPEFTNSSCKNTAGCLTNRLGQFMCLGRLDCLAASADTSPSDAVDSIAHVADSLSLFGNAALMDPAWRLGDQNVHRERLRRPRGPPP